MLNELKKRTTNTQDQAGEPVQAYCYPLKSNRSDVILAYHMRSVAIHYTRIRG